MGYLFIPLGEVARIKVIQQGRFFNIEEAAYQILPPDEIEIPEGIGGGQRGPSIGPVRLPERLRFLEDLNPQKIVAGLTGFGTRTYQAYVFGSVAILETDQYGNALYAVRSENLNELAPLTKRQLVSRKGDGFLAKIVHSEKWQERVRSLLLKNIN